MKKLVTILLAFLLFPIGASAAISTPTYSAVDTASSVTSVVTAGSGSGIVFVAGESASDAITAVTWNSVSMTKIGAVQVPGDRWISAWCVNDPASAATITFTGGTFWRSYSAFYPGGVCPPVDSFNTGTAGPSTGISVSTTVVDPDSWLIMFQKDATGGQPYTSSGSLTTTRVDSDAGGIAIGDSNGTVGAGSKTGTMDGPGGAAVHGAIVFSLAPPATPNYIQLLIRHGRIQIGSGTLYIR